MNDPVDDLLTEAGARWREQQPPPPRADTTRWPRRGRWVPAAVAAGVIVIAVGGVYSLSGDQPADPRPSPFAAGAFAPIPSLVVRDGMTVEATGTIKAKPGKPVLFCHPEAVPAISPGPETCTRGTPLVGLGDIPPAEQQVRLRGVWRGGVLTVTERLEPLPEEREGPGPLPCAPPEGGWHVPGNREANDLSAYVNEHADRFRRLRVAYPPGTSVGDIVVYVVEVVRGDVDDLGRELKARYSGNLCVVDALGKQSMAEENNVRASVAEQLRPLMENPANEIFSLGGDDGRRLELKMVTPELAERLSKVSPALDVRPWMRPLV